MSCRKCNLYKTSKAGIHTCVQLNGTGNKNAEIMLVGEAPGYNEIVERRPFVGKAGIELRQALQKIGINADDIFISNIVKCRPPANRTPTPEEISICAPYLIDEIKQVKPKVIGMLGNIPCSFFLNKTGITKLRGIPIWSDRFNCWLLPIYHPSYVMRFSQKAKQKKEFTEDLGKLKQLTSQPKETKQEKIKTNYILIKTIKQTKEIINILLKKDWVSFDVETTSKNPFISKVLCVTFSFKAGTAIYIPFQDKRLWKSDQEIEQVKEELKRFFISYVKKIAQDGKFDWRHLTVKGIKINQFVFDTLLASYLLDEEGAHDLGYLTLIHTDMGKYKDKVREYITGKIKIPDGEEEIITKKKQKTRQVSLFAIPPKENKSIRQKYRKSTILDCPMETLIEYACKDADATFRVFEKEKELLKAEQLDQLFNKILMPVVPVLAKMELSGILMDKSYIDKTCARIKSKLKTFMLNLNEDFNVKKYKEKIKEELDFDSPAQLRVLLFDIMNLPSIKKTAGGAESTEKDVLEELQKSHKIKLLDNIIKYRKIQKFYRTYLLNYQKRLLNSHDGRIHTNYKLTRTRTGRLASKSPNLQNVPEHGEESDIVKRAFITSPDRILLKADYSQIEFIVFAHEVGCPKLIALAREKDIHRSIASQIFKLSENEITKHQRGLAKTAVFGGIMYMGGAYILVSKFGISYPEAEKIISEFFDLFPKAKQYINKQLHFLHEYGYVKNLFQRRRRLSNIYHKEELFRSQAERQAINAPIQSGAADIMYITMRKLDNQIVDKNCSMLLNIHDALIFEIITAQLQPYTFQIKKIMEGAITLKCPLRVKFDIGNNLAEMQEYNI